MHILLALFPSFSRRLTGYPPISLSFNSSNRLLTPISWQSRDARSNSWPIKLKQGNSSDDAHCLCRKKGGRFNQLHCGIL